MCAPLGQWKLDNNKYITSWQFFLSHDLHTLHYREYGTWLKYTRPLKCTRARSNIAFQKDTKWVSHRPSWSQFCRISLISSSPTHLQIEATGLDFLPEPSEPPLESSEEEGTSYSQLCISFNWKNLQQKWMFTHLTFSNKLDVLYSDLKSRRERSGSDGSYQSKLRLISAAWII